MIRRLAMSGLAAVLLASATAALAETKQDPKAPAKPALTAEEQAALQQIKDLDKRLRIARLELALAEAKEAPEREIATKAEEMYRLQGEMHAFRVKHPGMGRLMRQERHRWGGRGAGGEGRAWGGGADMGRGGRHGMGGRGGGMAGPWAREGHGRGMGRQMGSGLGQGCPFADQGMGFGRGRGMGRGRGGAMGFGQGRGGMRGMGGGRGMGRRWQHEEQPVLPPQDLPEPQPAPEDQPAK
jgi:hypothetical protein